MSFQHASSLPSAFVERLIHFLMPYFAGITPSLDEARAEIIETLASYGARTRSQMLNAAKVIAYGLSGLDALYEAKTTEMSPSLRLRYLGAANNLGRSADKNELTLTKRLSHQQPEHTEASSRDIPDAEVQEAIELARDTIAVCRGRLPDARPTPAQVEADKQFLAGTRMDAIATMVMRAKPPETPAPRETPHAARSHSATAALVT